MFLINGLIIPISYNREMNVLVYNQLYKTYTFQVCIHLEQFSRNTSQYYITLNTDFLPKLFLLQIKSITFGIAFNAACRFSSKQYT